MEEGERDLGMDGRGRRDKKFFVRECEGLNSKHVLRDTNGRGTK